MISNNQTVDSDWGELVVLNERESWAVIRVEHQGVEELLDFLGRRVNRVIFQVQKEAFLFWIWGRIWVELSFVVVGDG